MNVNIVIFLTNFFSLELFNAQTAELAEINGKQSFSNRTKIVFKESAEGILFSENVLKFLPIILRFFANFALISAS